ncbi:hypothetical protein [Streptomyces sp. NPDC048496]|uniref:hypothetical protein n=1 Tax=Streptomyces sp. NPDC048496 TaxID=3365558 RepID=UPI0037191AA8
MAASAKSLTVREDVRGFDVSVDVSGDTKVSVPGDMNVVSETLPSMGRIKKNKPLVEAVRHVVVEGANRELADADKPFSETLHSIEVQSRLRHLLGEDWQSVDQDVKFRVGELAAVAVALLAELAAVAEVPPEEALNRLREGGRLMRLDGALSAKHLLLQDVG